MKWENTGNIENDIKSIEAYLLDIPRFTKKNTLEDTRRFLKELGDPCQKKNVIHIAGTNGKGSVCAYLSSVLEKGGYRVGMFTSPHLVSMRERFRIGSEMIGREQFADCFYRVKRQLEVGSMGQQGYHPSFFEMLFFMAMLYFEKEQAEVILLETGLGGRLDATNSVAYKALCIITEIGFDHMEYLGDTLPQIALEKAGILQKNVPLVFADRKNEASEAIKSRAEQLSCPTFPVSKADIRNLEFHKNFIDFSYNTRYYGYVRCRLSTCAAYQSENAALAVCALDVLSDQLPITKAALEAGLCEARWAGRMEEIYPDVFLDGAHNIDGIQAFLETVRGDGCGGRRWLLFSAVADKQYREIAEALTESKLFDRIYLTELKTARGLLLQSMQEAFGGRAEAAASSDAALELLLQEKGTDDKVYIAGSLYLVGEIKDYIKRNRNDQF